MTSKVRWGIIGAGRIANTFAADSRLVPDATLAAVASRSLASAQSFAARYGGIRAYGSYSSLFEDDQIDVVYIATPHNLHNEQVRAAISRGKAVLCEKPITVTPDECRSLQEYARSRRIYLMEGMWTWFLPAIRKAQNWIEAGRIGRVLHVNATFGYPLPYDPVRREYDSLLAGGCLLEMGIYPIAIAALFMAEDPESIEVVCHRAPNGVEDDVAILYRYTGGRSAALATSFRCKLPNWAYVIGTDGYIAIPNFWRANSCTLYQLDAVLDHYQEDYRGSGFEYQIAAVAADVQARRLESTLVPAAASLRFQTQLARIRALCPG